MSTELTKIRLHLAYDGTDFKGWQKQTRQPEPTIQGELEKALLKLTTFSLPTTGSGRTDAGAHALDQVVHFDSPDKISTNRDWIRGLNRYLPDSIRVQKGYFMPQSFHALKNAQSKVYTYTLQDNPTENPLLSRYSLWVQSPLDLEYLQNLSNVFLGTHDFKSFQTAGTEIYTTTRTLYEFKWERLPSGLVQAQIKGSGFLKQMVRNMIGTLTHQYWKKNLTPSHIKSILEAKDRSQAFGTAEAKGLCLKQVNYADNENLFSMQYSF